MTKNENVDGFSFSQGFQIAETVLNVVYDAFGKKTNTDAGYDFPGYQAVVTTKEDQKKYINQVFFLCLGTLATAGTLIYFGTRK